MITFTSSSLRSASLLSRRSLGAATTASYCFFVLLTWACAFSIFASNASIVMASQQNTYITLISKFFQVILCHHDTYGNSVPLTASHCYARHRSRTSRRTRRRSAGSFSGNGKEMRKCPAGTRKGSFRAHRSVRKVRCVLWDSTDPDRSRQRQWSEGHS